MKVEITKEQAELRNWKDTGIAPEIVPQFETLTTEQLMAKIYGIKEN